MAQCSQIHPFNSCVCNISLCVGSTQWIESDHADKVKGFCPHMAGCTCFSSIDILSLLRQNQLDHILAQLSSDWHGLRVSRFSASQYRLKQEERWLISWLCSSDNRDLGVTNNVLVIYIFFFSLGETRISLLSRKDLRPSSEPCILSEKEDVGRSFHVSGNPEDSVENSTSHSWTTRTLGWNGIDFSSNTRKDSRSIVTWAKPLSCTIS